MQTPNTNDAAFEDGAATSQIESPNQLGICTDDEIARRYTAGEQYDEIVKALGTSTRRIARVIREFGLEYRSEPAHRPPHPQAGRIMALHASGATVHSIAKRLGLGHETVKREFQRAGVVPNPPASGFPRSGVSDEAILAAMKDGMTDHGIIHGLGVGKDRVRRIRAASGIPLPRLRAAPRPWSERVVNIVTKRKPEPIVVPVEEPTTYRHPLVGLVRRNAYREGVSLPAVSILEAHP